MVDGDLLRYDAPEGAITEAVLTLLRQHKAALLTLLQQALPSAARALNQSTRDSYTRCPGRTDITRLCVLPVSQGCVA
jgi:hypothetical protein